MGKRDGGDRHGRPKRAKKMATAGEDKAKDVNVVKSQAPLVQDDIDLQEVLALGGTKEDYEWLKQADSNEESKNIDTGELHNFISALGFDKVQAQVEDREDAASNQQEDEAGEATEHVDDEADDTGDSDESDDANDDDVADVADEDHEKINPGKDEPEQSTEAKSQPPPVIAGLKGNSKLAAKYASFNVQPSQQRGGLILEPTNPWWKAVEAFDHFKPTSFGTYLASSSVCAKFRQYAERLYENQKARYESKFESENSSDVQWLKKVLTSGTLADKQAALVLRVQEAPIFRLSALENLMNMAQKKSKREALMACDSLYEVFSTTLLCPDRTLISFAQRPWYQVLEGGYFKSIPSKGMDRCVLIWFFEDAVKMHFKQYLTILKEMLKDPQANIKNKILNITFDLLKVFPEQEKLLLDILVNELGDSERKIASKACYLLHLLLKEHPALNMVLVKEVEPFLHRSNLKPRARYYALCFLNQLPFQREGDEEVANKVISVYFRFFEEQVKDNSNESSKLVAALLTGVNRAYPFSSIERSALDKHSNSLFRMVHTSSFNCSIQALSLLFQVMDAHQEVSDRFYRVLYGSLIDSRMPTSSKHASYLNLLFKALKTDPNLNRVKAFIKRLLQISPLISQQFTCGCLVLLSELFKVRPSLRSMLDLPEDREDDEVLSYNPLKREPEFSNAESTGLWEIASLSRYFSPSALVFVQQILDGQTIDYQGDPLQDFTLMKFLDKFVFKAPKKNVSKQSLFASAPSEQSVQMNAGYFRDKKTEDIAPDELFYFHYFKLKAEKQKTEKQSKPHDTHDLGDIDIDDFDDIDFAKSFGKGDLDGDDNDALLGDESDKSDEEENGVQSNNRESSALDLKDFKQDFGSVQEYSYDEFDEATFEDPEDENDDDGAEEDLMHLESGISDESEDEEFDENEADRGPSNAGDVFAAADEFSQLLEEDETGAVDKHELRRKMRQKLGMPETQGRKQNRKDVTLKPSDKQGRKHKGSDATQKPYDKQRRKPKGNDLKQKRRKRK